MDETVMKPINFPLSMLRIIDSYAKVNNLCRAAAIRKMIQEFIDKHELNEAQNV